MPSREDVPPKPAGPPPPRPRVILNCACSLDGKLAAPDGSPMLLSDETDLRRVHRLRAQSDAILVGIGTVLSDDPSLKVKEEYAAVPPNRKLLRVILDSKGRTPPGARAVDASAPSLVATGPDAKLRLAHADVARLPLKDGEVDLVELLAFLHRRGVRQLMVEGGGTVLRSFVRDRLVDEWTIYQAPVMVGGNGPNVWPGTPSGQGRRLHVMNVETQGKGVLWTLRP